MPGERGDSGWEQAAQVCFRQDRFPVSTSASSSAGAVGGGDSTEGLCCC